MQDTITIELNGLKITATRTAYTTSGHDPTRVVRWSSDSTSQVRQFDITEFQGSYTGSIDGRVADQPSLVDPQDQGDIEMLTNIHQGLESAFDTLSHWLDNRERDPMPGPEYYE